MAVFHGWVPIWRQMMSKYHDDVVWLAYRKYQGYVNVKIKVLKYYEENKALRHKNKVNKYKV